MKILVIEPLPSGHRLNYLRIVIDGLLDAGLDVTLGTTDKLYGSKGFAELFGHRQSTLKTVLVSLDGYKLVGRQRVTRELEYRKLFSDIYKRAVGDSEFDLVFVCCIDYIRISSALFGLPFKSTKAICLSVGQTFHFENRNGGKLSRFKKWLDYRLFKRFLANDLVDCVIVIDPILYDKRSSLFEGLSAKVKYVVDPSNVPERSGCSKAEIRKSLGIPESHIVILVIGTIDKRKNVDGLMRAIVEIDSKNFTILISGQNSDRYPSHWRSGKAQVVSIPGYYSDDQEYEYFKTSDIVWVCYKGHYAMSGVMISAGRMGLPIIASSDGLIGQMTAKNRAGLVVDPCCTNSISSALQELGHTADLAHELGDNGKRAYGLHKTSVFKQTTRDLVFSALVKHGAKKI